MAETEGLKAALETTKQVIGLSTGIITLTVTFLEKIVQPHANSMARHVPVLLEIAWVCFGLATAFAIWTLMAITGTMNALDRQSRQLPLNYSQRKAAAEMADGANIRVPALAMLLLFGFGIAMTIASGFFLIRYR